MRLAFISPISWLPTTAVTDYQLMLPHLVADYHEYATHYRSLAKQSNQYVILDNGEAEGKKNRFSPAQLVGMGIYAEVDEVVVPDVIGDQVETLNSMKDFFHQIFDLRNDAFGPRDIAKLKFMGVVQGQTYKEALDCIDMMLELYGDKLHTIALPRHLLETTGDHSIRLSLAQDVHYHFKGAEGIDIHCLGSSHLWPKELLELAKQGIVRGLDTSMPYNWAYQGAFMNEEGLHIKRPLRYFSRPARNFDNNALHYNLSICRRWANGDDRLTS
jgi:hypothetical protein